jgi:hypothetical protein
MGEYLMNCYELVFFDLDKSVVISAPTTLPISHQVESRVDTAL